MRRIEDYSPYQFSLLRILFGLYLLGDSLLLILYQTEWIGPAVPRTAVPDLLALLFPQILGPLVTPLAVRLLLVLRAVLALSLLIGFQRRWVALLLWFPWRWLIDRVDLGSFPILAGWLLLVMVLAPAGEAFSLSPRARGKWEMPSTLFWSSWVVLGLALLQDAMGRWMLQEWLDLSMFSWLLVGLEALFLASLPWTHSRKFAWMVMLVAQALALVFTGRIQALGFLFLLLLTFDPRWFPPRPAVKDHPVVFFDGVCGLCNAFIDFLFTIDTHQIFRVAALQGTTAKARLGKEVADLEALKSIVLWDETGLHRESDAVLTIASRLGGMWRAAEIFRVIPERLRNAVYHFIAHHRYQWFGKKETCRLPTPEERALFLD